MSRPRPRRLTAPFVRSVREVGVYGDGHGGLGLALHVRLRVGGDDVTKVWTQRITIDDKRTNVGLGQYPRVTLSEARTRALENVRAIDRGADPRRPRRGTSGERAVTFEQAAEAVIALHAPTWRDPRREHNWRSSLERFAYESLGDRPVGEIDAADILAVVAPIWATRRETARKLLGRIRAVVRWAVAEGLRDSDPTDSVRAALPKNGNGVKHHEALAPEQIAANIAAVRASGATDAVKDCYELIALTAVRSGEARGAAWSEIDLDSATWTIPPERYKTATGLRVPLARRALEVLEAARERTGGDPDGVVFPGPTGRPLSSESLSKLLRSLDLPGTVHGARASVRSWAAEQGVNRETAEMLLGHVVGGVEGAYQRSDLLEARREVAQRWSEAISG